jgi:hypothetical protein
MVKAVPATPLIFRKSLRFIFTLRPPHMSSNGFLTDPYFHIFLCNTLLCGVDFLPLSGASVSLIIQAIMEYLFLGPSLQKGNPPSPIAPFQLLGHHNTLVFSRNGGFQALGFDFTGQAFFRRVPQAIFGHGKHLAQITKTWRVVALHGTAPLLLTTLRPVLLNVIDLRNL